MPQSLYMPGVDTTRRVDETFLELLCADEELLRAEFDAIIAAEWPSAPPGLPGLSADAEQRRRRTRQRREASAATLPRWHRDPGAGGWYRQRSPPSSLPDRLQERTPGKAGDDPA